ncbi:hypothetical protein [Breoghania sp.]|uniref:O-antigen ligase family protein n=1 Tax=Breoghania sp. TaxID=2065378 RepID=UPI002619464F|nr:hypothetical protein [Breoghania sp.]MDJ0930991.1 hypothetical protein [Breoghania sp.]
MAFALLFCLYGAAVKHGKLRALFTVLALAALYAMVMSKSKTSLGLAILLPPLICFVIVITRALRMNAALFLSFCFVLGLSVWFYLSAMTRFGLAKLSMLLFGDETFTRRTVHLAVRSRRHRPRPAHRSGICIVLGDWGRSIVEREAPGFVVDLLQAHNGYLDLVVETGFIGLAILLALILTALFAAARTAATRPALCWLSMTIVITVACHNMLESSWFRGYSLIWMLFIMAALLPRAPSHGADPGATP